MAFLLFRRFQYEFGRERRRRSRPVRDEHWSDTSDSMELQWTDFTDILQ